MPCRAETSRNRNSDLRLTPAALRLASRLFPQRWLRLSRRLPSSAVPRLNGKRDFVAAISTRAVARTIWRPRHRLQQQGGAVNVDRRSGNIGRLIPRDDPWGALCAAFECAQDLPERRLGHRLRRRSLTPTKIEKGQRNRECEFSYFIQPGSGLTSSGPLISRYKSRRERYRCHRSCRQQWR
jgi:hypothetical protein